MDAATRVYLVLPLIMLGWCLVFGGLGAWVATQKGRGGSEGALLGVLLGAFGVILEALLPNRLTH